MTRLSLEMGYTHGSYLMDKEIAQVANVYWKAVGIEIKDLGVIDSSTNSKMRANQGAGSPRTLMNSLAGPGLHLSG